MEERIESVITISTAVGTIYGTDLNSDAKKVFLEKLYKVIENFKYDVSSYTDAKTSVDLAKKVFQQIDSDEKGGFTFSCKGITYTYEYEMVAKAGGASWTVGTITESSGKKYICSVVSKNSKSIESEMIYLKEFADMKIKEARDATYSEAATLLGIDKLTDQFFKNVKATYTGKAKDVIKSKFPELFRMAEGANSLKSKVDGVKSAYKSLTPPDWTGDLGQKVIKDISSYHEKVNALIAAVEALVD